MPGESFDFRLGDVVTRDGTDEHLVYGDIDNGYGNMDVVCIKEPSQKWIKIGETESNLVRRYEFKYRLLNWRAKLREIGREDLEEFAGAR